MTKKVDLHIVVDQPLFYKVKEHKFYAAFGTYCCRESMSSYNNTPVKVVDLGMDTSDTSHNFRSRMMMEQRYKQGRYVFLSGRSNNNEITRFLFDTKDEKISKAPLINNMRVDVVKKEDTVEVHDISNNSIIYNFKNDENYHINLSSTEKYLMATSKRKTMLIDLDKKMEIDTPVSGMLYFSWSEDDKRAIISKYSNDSSLNTTDYLWDPETNTATEFITEANYRRAKWGFHGDFIYSISSTNNGHNFRIYDTTQKQWKEVYFTDLRLEEDSGGNIRWISADEFLYVGSKNEPTIFDVWGPKYNYYAVKVNLKKHSDKRIKLQAISARYSVWSYDNKYIYYIDRRNDDNMTFSKIKVNF